MIETPVAVEVDELAPGYDAGARLFIDRMRHGHWFRECVKPDVSAIGDDMLRARTRVSLSLAETIADQRDDRVERLAPRPGRRSSSTTRPPLPAASIITPMMLLALILRPLRASETSH